MTQRLQEYHFDGLDPLQYAKLGAIVAFWLGLFFFASDLTIWQAILLVGFASFLTATIWRDIINSKPAGCWLTDSHLHIYYGVKHWSFPLSGIKTIRGRRSAFSLRAPVLELSNGRRVSLPITALPSEKHLRRWFGDTTIRVKRLAINERTTLASKS